MSVTFFPSNDTPFSLKKKMSGLTVPIADQLILTSHLIVFINFIYFNIIGIKTNNKIQKHQLQKGKCVYIIGSNMKAGKKHCCINIMTFKTSPVLCQQGHQIVS